MFKLLDFKTTYRDNGCDVQADDYYFIKNNVTGESRWVDEYEYRSIKYKGLME